MRQRISGVDPVTGKQATGAVADTAAINPANEARKEAVELATAPRSTSGKHSTRKAAKRK